MDIDKAKEVIRQIDEIRAGGLSVVAASEKLGINPSGYYDAKNLVEGKPLRPPIVSETAQVKSSMFQIAKAEEARDWVSQHRSGRFMEIKEQLVVQIRTLRKTEALHFPVDITNKKELTALLNACKNALKNAELTWAVRYSASKQSIVILHQDNTPVRKHKKRDPAV